MPAIQLARLRIQAARLAASFSQPALFVRGLHDLLDFYADRTHRPGQAGEPSPLIPAYNVPAPVIRQVLNEITSQTRQEPAAALALIDALWQENNFECRLIAAALMGLIPLEYREAVLERVRRWAPKQEDRVLSALLEQGLASLRKDSAESMVKLLEAWLASRDMREVQVGLRALITLIEERRSDKIPALFRLLTPLVRTPPAILRHDLIETLRALARSSPGETAHFLRQNLNYDLVPWFVRQVIHDLPVQQQESLRAALRELA